MQAIILADRKGEELLPLTDNTSVALLPLAGKPVLEHTLEALVEAGIRKALIVVSAYAGEVKKTFGNGERWGMDITYCTSRGEEAPEQILTMLPSPASTPVLMLRGDVVRTKGLIREFLRQAENRPDSFLPSLSGTMQAFMVLCRDLKPDAFSSLVWPPCLSTYTGINLEGRVSPLDSLPSYHQANLDAVAGRLELRLPGKQTALGLIQGRKSKVYPQNIKQGVALIGSHCSLFPSVQFKGEVAIGDHVIIDRCASLENTVVLPYSYIGELVELRNAIVRGNDLIRIDIGSILKVSDAFLLANLANSPLNKGIGTAFNRIIGIALLLISLPFWLLAGMQILLRKSDPPVLMQRLRGNKIVLDEFGMPQRAEFVSCEFNLKSPVLRYLPRILAVVSGDLRLVGALPVSLEAASKRQEEWEKFADQASAGLIGPTQLTLASDAPAEEKLMADSFYWAHFSWSQDLRYMILGLQTLFSRKAWLEENGNGK